MTLPPTVPNPPSRGSGSNSLPSLSGNNGPPRRFAQIIKLKPEHREQYIQLHASVWPGVLSQIKKCGIHDYSIFYDQDLGILFATFKYTGHDFEGDMAKMAKDEETRKWWGITDEMQSSFNEGAKGSESGGWWKELREVFHVE